MGQTTRLTRTELEYLAREILGSEEAAKAWLMEPRREFDDRSACELLETDLGCGQVVMALQRLENDIVASSFKSESM